MNSRAYHLQSTVIYRAIRVPVLTALLNSSLFTKYRDGSPTERRHLRCDVSRKEGRSCNLDQLFLSCQNCLCFILPITKQINIQGAFWFPKIAEFF